MNLKQKLDAIAEERSKEKFHEVQQREDLNIVRDFARITYKMGASDMSDLLLPLLTEAIETLEHYTCTHYDLRNYPCDHDKSAQKALNLINEKLELLIKEN